MDKTVINKRYRRRFGTGGSVEYIPGRGNASAVPSLWGG